MKRVLFFTSMKRKIDRCVGCIHKCRKRLIIEKKKWDEKRFSVFIFSLSLFVVVIFVVDAYPKVDYSSSRTVFQTPSSLRRFCVRCICCCHFSMIYLFKWTFGFKLRNVRFWTFGADSQSNTTSVASFNNLWVSPIKIYILEHAACQAKGDSSQYEWLKN